jgi:hypothetical protein
VDGPGWTATATPVGHWSGCTTAPVIASDCPRATSLTLAELALFDRDPDAYLTKVEASEKAAAEAVFMEPELVARFLAHLKAEGRTECYRRNVRTYLAQWAETLAGRDLREVTLQQLKRELAKYTAARKHRIIALKSFRTTGSPWAFSPR